MLRGLFGKRPPTIPPGESHRAPSPKEEEKSVRNRLAVAVACLLVTVVALAQQPARNVSGRRHPNIAAAQRLSQQAFGKIIAAQRANEWDMAGHAQKAKELLEQANAELKQAAEAANRNPR
jgi:F0F1-type ATP synthase membrane subunit b/b'